MALFLPCKCNILFRRLFFAYSYGLTQPYHGFLNTPISSSGKQNTNGSTKQSPYKGRWKLAADNSGVSAMHMFIFPKTNKVFMFDGGSVWSLSNSIVFWGLPSRHSHQEQQQRGRLLGSCCTYTTPLLGHLRYVSMHITTYVILII